MIRILFFNYEYPPLGGGAGNATAYIFKEFAKIPDLEVDLITSSINSEYHLEKIGSNITIHRLPIGKDKNNLHFQSQKDLLIYSWKAYHFSLKLARQNKYDLTHAFFSIPCGYLAQRLRKRFEIPYIVSLRGADVPGYSERFSLVYKLFTPLIKTIWKDASRIVSNSEGLKKLAEKTEKVKSISVVYNGIDTQEFYPLKNNIRNENIFKIICVSRITPRKGIRYLIEAVKILREKYPQIRLEIIGEGNEKEELIKLSAQYNLSEQVAFLGLISHNQLPRYYQNAHVFILPSLNEGMSNTMLEAIASGLPIIATDTGGTKELVSDAENGFIIKMKDPDDLVKKLEIMINNQKLRETMSIKSRQLSENFSWQKVTQKYYKIYNDVIADF